jgi:hypothetical protein
MREPDEHCCDVDGLDGGDDQLSGEHDLAQRPGRYPVDRHLHGPVTPLAGRSHRIDSRADRPDPGRAGQDRLAPCDGGIGRAVESGEPALAGDISANDHFGNDQFPWRAPIEREGTEGNDSPARALDRIGRAEIGQRSLSLLRSTGPIDVQSCRLAHAGQTQLVTRPQQSAAGAERQRVEPPIESNRAWVHAPEATAARLELVDRRASTDTSASPSHVHSVVADLSRYPEWLDEVTRVDPAEGRDDAWLITLRARVGPFARSKRLRMVRSRNEVPHHVRFERAEVDGRNHSAWTLDAIIEPTVIGSRVTMHLVYDGNLWSGVLDRVLGSMIDDAIPDLKRLVESPG